MLTDVDPALRAALFGTLTLVALFAVLWLWYDTSGSQDSGWPWRIGGSLLVVLTLPAVVLGAANFDSSRDTLFNVLAVMALVASPAALLAVGAYSIWGKTPVSGDMPWQQTTGGGAMDPTITGGMGGSDEYPMPPTLTTGPGLTEATQTATRLPVRSDAFLFVKEGPDKGRQFPLPDVAIIGRSNGCAIVLDDRRVSNEHAQVKRADGQYIFTDLRSTNGSFFVVAGREEPVRTAQVLVDGDLVRIGRTLLGFVDTRRAARR